MPSFTTRGFSSGYEPDAFDAADAHRFGQANNNAALMEQAREFNIGTSMNAAQSAALQRAMLQSHMAGLGFGREKLGFDREQSGKQFDYLKGVSDTQAKQYQQQFEAGAPGRESSDMQAKASTALLVQQLAQMQDEMKRQQAAKSVGAPADLVSAPAPVRAQYQSDLATSDPATANANYQKSLQKVKEDTAEGMATDLGADISALNERDKAWFSSEPNDAERSRILGEFKNLVDQYKGAGLPASAAAAKAKEVIRKSAPIAYNAGWTKDIYDALGIGR